MDQVIYSLSKTTLELADLGLFERLPYEIRSIIYTRCIELRSAGLLCLNRRFSTEFSETLYEYVAKTTLVLQIDPARDPSVIQILTPSGQPWGRHRSTVNVASPHIASEIKNPLRAMPVGRFKAIRVLIDAPDIEDEGQALRLFKQMSALVVSLSAEWFERSFNSEESGSSAIVWPDQACDCNFPAKMKIDGLLPPISLVFQDSSSASWLSANGWQQSIPALSAGQDDESLLKQERYTDIELALQPLRRLRRASSIQWTLPREQLCHGRLEQLCRDIVSLAKQEKDFGLLSGDRDDDEDILAELASIQCWHDYLLDDLRGVTANKLRHERFVNWCRTYEIQQYHAIYAPDENVPKEEAEYSTSTRLSWGGAVDGLDNESFRLIAPTFLQRFQDYLLYDPMMHPQGCPPRSYDKIVLVWQIRNPPREVFMTPFGVHCKHSGANTARRCALCAWYDEDEDEEECLAGHWSQLSMIGVASCVVCEWRIPDSPI